MKKLDYTIGFQAGRAAQSWTATPLTDRAKERTPEPLTFAGRVEALKFLKESQAKGYRFSSPDLLDPDQRLVKNRYFVIEGDGQLTLSGDDNGPRDTVWEIGDVMPGRWNAGIESVIENILQGPGVRGRFGCDLAFLLRLHRVMPKSPATSSAPPFDSSKPCPCGLRGKSYSDCCKDKGAHALGNEMLRGTTLRMVPGALAQIQSSMVQGDTRFRIVWNTLWPRPQTEPFDALPLREKIRTICQRRSSARRGNRIDAVRLEFEFQRFPFVVYAANALNLDPFKKPAHRSRSSGWRPRSRTRTARRNTCAAQRSCGLAQMAANNSLRSSVRSCVSQLHPDFWVFQDELLRWFSEGTLKLMVLQILIWA